MEPRRMPLPAAWLTLPQVGTGRDQGSGIAARTDPQIGCLLWRGEPAHRQIRAGDVRCVQRPNLRGLPQEATAAPCARPTHGGRIGQRQIPPCRVAGAAPAQVPRRAVAALPPTIQPTTGTDRAGLETRPPTRHAQPIFRHAHRSTRGRQRLLRPMAQAQFSVAATMLHYLRRCV
jgi:hypothetical protein